MNSIRSVGPAPPYLARPCLARWLQALEQGEDQSFEFTTVIVPIVVMISLIAFATIVRAAQMPAWTAAAECAREGIATVDQTLGRQQAYNAAMGSLSGNAISASSVQVNITGDWTPDTLVTCRVSYDIDVSGIAGISELVGGKVPISAQVALRVEPYKSKWQ